MRYVNHEKVLNVDLEGKPGADNPGGGIPSKVWNIKRAFPKIEVSHELGGVINLIDPIWINMFNSANSLKEKLEQIKDSGAVNILWQEELAMFRLTIVAEDGKGTVKGDYRFDYYNEIDYIFNCNQYLNNMMKSYIGLSMNILYTPIDSQFFMPAPVKKKQILAMGRICYQKNIRGIIDMFKALPNSIDKVYVGNVHLWGKTDEMYDTDEDDSTDWRPLPEDLENEHNIKLQNELKDVCDWHPSLNKHQVADMLSESWGYINMSRYDTGCLSFLESAMSGCHCFCWGNHPMFDEYGFVNRFSGIEDGSELIVKTLEMKPNANMSIRNLMMVKHSYESVNESLRRLVGGILL